MPERINKLHAPFDWRTDPSTGNRRLFVHGNPGYITLINELQSGKYKENISTEVVDSNIIKMQEVYTTYDTLLTEGGMIIPHGDIVPIYYFHRNNFERIIQALEVNLMIVNKAALIDKEYKTTIRQDFNLAQQSSIGIVKPNLVERLSYWNLKSGAPFFQYKAIYGSPKHLWPLENLLMALSSTKLEELESHESYSIIGKESLHRQILTDIVATKGLGNIRANDIET